MSLGQGEVFLENLSQLLHCLTAHWLLLQVGRFGSLCSCFEINCLNITLLGKDFICAADLHVLNSAKLQKINTVNVLDLFKLKCRENEREIDYDLQYRQMNTKR